MCKVNNIENLDPILCALKELYKGQQIAVTPILLTAAKIAALPDSSKRLFYGIVTVGNTTEVTLSLMDNSVITVPEQNQIIELFNTISIDTGANIFFRGYEITVTGVEFS